LPAPVRGKRISTLQFLRNPRLLTHFLSWILCAGLALLPASAIAQTKPGQTEAPAQSATTDAERQALFERCSGNNLSRVYFDCECVADAYIARLAAPQEGDSRGNLEARIYDDLPSCVNREGIIASYTNPLGSCMQQRTLMGGQLEDAAQRGCQCTGEHVANAFAVNARLRTHVIQDMAVDAMVACRAVN